MEVNFINLNDGSIALGIIAASFFVVINWYEEYFLMICTQLKQYIKGTAQKRYSG